MTDITLPLGQHRSGRARYAAAMTLCQAGQLSPAGLEVYRICSLLHVADPALAHAIDNAAPFLNWITYDSYPPTEIGKAFATNHCFASIMGEDTTMPAQDFDLFLIAPHILYRDHNHAAPDLYAPLTGPHGWRFGAGRPLIVKPAHDPVWNDRFRPHLTKVGPTPFLALFGWTRDVQTAAQVIPAPDWPALKALRLDAPT